MEDIKQIFTIQWVGPFASLKQMKEYLNRPETCEKQLFTFYYICGSKNGSGYHRSKTDYRYFGIHKQTETSIEQRLNNAHEHLCEFREDSRHIWIGSFANCDHQSPQNIEDTETLFISTYRNELTENKKKKKATPSESICVVNLWYKEDETEWKKRKAETRIFSDVMVYEKELGRFSVGNLKAIER